MSPSLPVVRWSIGTLQVVLPALRPVARVCFPRLLRRPSSCTLFSFPHALHSVFQMGTEPWTSCLRTLLVMGTLGIRAVVRGNRGHPTASRSLLQERCQRSQPTWVRVTVLTKTADTMSHTHWYQRGTILVVVVPVSLASVMASRCSFKLDL